MSKHRIVTCLHILSILSIGCTTQRTPEETKQLLLGRWETVTTMEYELPFVFNDSVLECEEFVPCGRYEVFHQDSVRIFGVDTVTFNVRFPEAETTLILAAQDWDPIRLKKIVKQ